MRDRRQVAQQLRAGALVVRLGVGRVAVLVEHHPVRILLGELLGGCDRLVRTAGRRRGDDPRAEHLEQLAPLDRGVLRHHAHQPVAAQLGHHRQRDAGVARGRLEDRAARRQPAVGLRRAHHGERGAVLDRTGRVAVLELGPQPDRDARPPSGATGAAARRAGCRPSRRSASRNASCELRQRRLPPATAGRIVTLSPSLTGVSSEPVKRTSSSLTYTLTKRCRRRRR